MASLTHLEGNLFNHENILKEVHPKYLKDHAFIGTKGSFVPLEIEGSLFHILNLNLVGEPKLWWIIPPEEKERLVTLIRSMGIFGKVSNSSFPIIQTKNEQIS